MTCGRFREMRADEIEQIVLLWERCGLTRPWNDPANDIAFALGGPASTVLVGQDGDAIVASVMVGHDGHRGGVYYLAVDPDHQGSGLGRAAMQAAEDWLRQHGVWKLNLMVRSDNKGVVDFYRALGYEIEERINLSRRLEPSQKP